MAMDWRAVPGDGDCDYRPPAHVVSAYEDILASTKLKLKSFEKDQNEIWRAFDVAVERGALSNDDFVNLRKDHNGHFSIPLARKYFAVGKTDAVTKWMRDRLGFWDYNWVDRNVHGGYGRGTINLFRAIQSEGDPQEGARLAAVHFAKRFSGARYHRGLRGELKTWYNFSREERRAKVAQHRAKYGRPHHIEVVFAWMNYISGPLSPFVADGDQETIAGHEGVLAKLEKEQAKFEADLEGLPPCNLTNSSAAPSQATKRSSQAPQAAWAGRRLISLLLKGLKSP